MSRDGPDSPIHYKRQCPSVGCPPYDMTPQTIFTREYCILRYYSLGDFVPPRMFSGE